MTKICVSDEIGRQFKILYARNYLQFYVRYREKKNIHMYRSGTHRVIGKICINSNVIKCKIQKACVYTPVYVRNIETLK